MFWDLFLLRQRITLFSPHRAVECLSRLKNAEVSAPSLMHDITGFETGLRNILVKESPASFAAAHYEPKNIFYFKMKGDLVDGEETCAISLAIRSRWSPLPFYALFAIATMLRPHIIIVFIELILMVYILFTVQLVMLIHYIGAILDAEPSTNKTILASLFSFHPPSHKATT